MDIVGIGAPTQFLDFVLRQQGVRIERGAPVRVILTDDYLRPEVQQAVAGGERCLLAKPLGTTLWVGPWIDSESEVCFECLRWWLTLNRDPQKEDAVRLPSTDVMAAGWIATVATGGPDLRDSILHFDTKTQTLHRSRLVARGNCRCAKSMPPIEALEGRYTGLVREIARGEVFGVAVSLGQVRLGAAGPQVVAGKGASREEALRACVGEALERYALVFQGTEPLLDRCVEAVSLSGGPSIPVPAEQCYFWLPDSLNPTGHEADSSGCACGPDRDAAVTTGLMELIERDAVAIWWYNRIQAPAFDAGALGDTRLRDMCRRAQAEGWTVTLLDITTDLGVPACVACLERDGRIRLGSAADREPAVAAVKALCEAALVEFWMSASGPDAAAARWLNSLSTTRHPQLVSNGSVSTTRALEGPLGLQAYAVDLTRPETRWPVTRVIVPGLRRFNDDLAPGRLYDVPVSLRWLPRARHRDEMETTRFEL